MGTNDDICIDLFSGAGGLSLGFRMAGFAPVFAVDSDLASCRTYHRNFGETAHNMDICEVSKELIEKVSGRQLTERCVIVGGPPCQGFSVQRRGSNEDSRNLLVLEFMRLVLEIQPLHFVMENVSGLLSRRGESVMGKLKEKFWENGYVLHIKKLNACDFGVPQMRKRVFIVGERTDSGVCHFKFPEKTNGIDLNVRDFIKDLMTAQPDSVPNHIADKLSPINLERIRHLKPGQSREDLPEHLRLNCHKTNGGHRHVDVYGRMPWQGLAPTITARFDSFSRGRFGHPNLDRSITIREGARLQTFPDTFVFEGTKGEMARQIGNAVPPLLAKAIALSVKESLIKNETLAQRK